MAYCRQLELPAKEPVTVAEAKKFARIFATDDGEDRLITGLIQAARERCEVITGRSLAKRKFCQVLDAYPYFTDPLQSPAYPMGYWQLPMYATTLWNQSQQIKLGRSPVISVEQIRYVGTDGSPVTLSVGTDFVLDRVSEPGRIYPKAGGYWPPALAVANAVEIDFTAGYDPDPTAEPDTFPATEDPALTGQQPRSIIVTAIPEALRTAILMDFAHLYQNREAVSDAQLYEVPLGVQSLLGAYTIVDFAPTRG